MEEFKKGIRFCLTHLNEGDVFNIVAFKDETVFFSGEPLAASPETVAGAERFVAGLASTKRTDMHTALRKIVETPLHHEPSNILLLSDGRPTSGIVDAREFLASLTRLNGKTRPIFVYSGGAKVNRYLLDFIAYQNRGWSQFTKRGSEIATGLADFYRKIKDPIFLHLRYRFNRLDESGIYPKSLPDFYKNTEFTLYGTYRTENEFSMQLLGDIEGETKELVFTRSLDDAPKGGPDIMKGWAFNKIYHLIDQVTREGNRPELLKAIEDLSRKYGIQTPYSPELQRLD
ncbi:MAG: hypothetical protein HYT75_05710 [Deltaproteobacteria bacterium]|nr:hypothetical protein [Deltaproteobacteria bacterium]